MKIIKKEIKKKCGFIEIIIETIEDMWHLQYILEEDDIVQSLTKRKPETNVDKIRPEKLEKVNIYLGIRINKIEFHDYSNRLRIFGIITYGTQIGFNHTINIIEGTKLFIQKKIWKKDQIERLNDSVKSSSTPKLILVGIEEGEADIGLVKHYGIDLYFHIQKSIGKRINGLREEFFKEVLNQLIQLNQNNTIIILCGPGFTKEDFLKYIVKVNNTFQQNIILKESSSIGISGFLEILKNGCLNKILSSSRIEKEAFFMDKLLEEIAKNGKATYGYNEVLKFIEFGNIDVLLITDEFLKEGRIKKNNTDSILESVELLNGKIIIFSTNFEPGIKLQKLGGIAAIIKYKTY